MRHFPWVIVHLFIEFFVAFVHLATLGLPHFSSQDDVYNEYRIPNKTLIIGNIW